MPANPSTSRFFAITAERLEAITLHRLTLADVKVWSLVELQAKPRHPIPFTLERIALALGLGVNTVRRSLRRLVLAGMLVGHLEGGRYHLAPAEPAFTKAPDTLPNRIGDALSPDALEDVEREDNLPNRSGLESEALPNRIGDAAPNEGAERVTANPPKKLKSIDQKKSFNACALTGTLSRDWGIYAPVAARLVATYGRERVGAVVRWGEHLKATGKLRSRGWVYQALTRGWEAPSTFHQAAYEARAGASTEARVSTIVQAPERPVEAPLDDQAKRETIARMLANPFPASKRLAAKLAGDWGIDLEALEVAV